VSLTRSGLLALPEIAERRLTGSDADFGISSLFAITSIK
jgi:hypothetical protein